MTPDNTTPLRDYFEQVYRRLKLAGRAAHTVDLYVITFKHFAKFLGREATLADLDDDTITALMGWLVEGDRSPRTANKTRDQLCAIWRYAARKQHKQSWPDVQPFPEFKRQPRAWTIEQFTALVSLASDPKRAQEINSRQRTIERVPVALWWKALLLTLYDSGIRIGAAMQLRCSDFDAQRRCLFVRAESQKTRADQSFILSEQTAAVLVKCIAADNRDLLFPFPFHVGTLYNRFNRMVRAAGLPCEPRNVFHRIRKTSATMCELHVGAGSATRHLGHSSPTMTASHYLDPTMLPVSSVGEKLPRPVVPAYSDGGQFYLTSEIAALINVSPRTVAKWIDAGLLSGESMPVTNERRVARDALIEFLTEYRLPMGGLDGVA